MNSSTNKTLYLLAAILALNLVLGQDFDQCSPTDVLVESPEVLNQTEEVKPSLEDVLNYIDLCIPNSGGDGEDLNVGALMRKTSDLCLEFPIHNGTRRCEARSSTRYGFSVEEGKCIAFTYTGCGGNENNFATLDECSNACEDPCAQSADNGEGDNREPRVTTSCSRAAGTYYYFNRSTRTCSRFSYRGCGGNKNRFESLAECSSVCGARVSPTPTRNRRIGSRRIRSANIPRPQTEGVDVDSSAFCSNFTETFPETAEVIEAIDQTSSNTTNAFLVRELHSQIVPENQSSRSKRQISIFNLLLGPLKHTTAKIYRREACRRVRVTIRIWCVRGLFNRPTIAQRNKLCQLVKDGIKRYWERPVVIGGITYPVVVTVQESLLLSKKVILKWYNAEPSIPALTRSYNLGWTWVPMVMKYRGYEPTASEDADFTATSAHEFGHDVLMASGGLVWSWGHEGTSTIFGSTLASAPSAPAFPAEINLMKYYQNPYPSTYYTQVRATQQQVSSLINLATFRFNIWWCSGAIGAPCWNSNQCNPPGVCHWFRCVVCNADNQCPGGQYCHGINNPFQLNECRPGRPNGQLCLRDSMCQSGMCDGGQCVECEVDGHCPPNQFCRWNNVPFVLNTCTNKHPNGHFCLQDRVCASGFCDGLQCVECESNSHCPSGQWCKNKNLPGILNVCVNKLGNGAGCISNSQCASGHCWFFHCVQCESNSHCPSGQFCRFPARTCANKKPNGAWCIRDSQCASNNCRWFKCRS